jgi:hypothetical protein
MWTDFWEWLAKLPPASASFVGTLTGSTLGLIALLVGALFNAHLNRRRDDRARNQDRLAVASTLHAELVGIHRTLVENAQRLLDDPPQDGDEGFMVPEPSIKLLPGMLSKIGLLPSETVRKVMDAYVLTEQYHQDLVLAGGQLQDKMPKDRHLIYMNASRAEFVAKLNRTRAGVVKEAIETLDPYLRR